jgi:DNA-binding response OmpR family regulator
MALGHPVHGLFTGSSRIGNADLACVAQHQGMAVRTSERAEVLTIGPLEITPGEHLARVNGHALTLSQRELCLLTELSRRADRIVSREELFELVWERPMRPGDRSVDVYVRKLRVKLETSMPDWVFIHTHFGFGYRIAAEPRQPMQPVA